MLKFIVMTLCLLLSNVVHSTTNNIELIDYIKNKHVNAVIVGDAHGTVEAPDKLYSLITQLLPEYSHIYVALEVPPEALALPSNPEVLNNAIIQYASNTRFWSRAFQDGRSSKAMASLIHKLKKEPTNKVTLVALSQPFSANKKKRKEPRFQKSASEVLKNLKNNELVVFSVGNLHASRNSTPQRDLSLPPKASFAQWVSSSHNTVTFRMLFGKGTAWQCVPDKVKPYICAARKKVAPIDVKALRPGFMVYEKETDGYDGYYYFNEISSSPPLINSIR